MIKKRYKSIVATTCLMCMLFSNNVYAARYSFSFTGTASRVGCASSGTFTP